MPSENWGRQRRVTPKGVEMKILTDEDIKKKLADKMKKKKAESKTLGGMRLGKTQSKSKEVKK